MSKKIYGVLTDNFIRQMRNWALTNAGVIPERGIISSIYSGILNDTYGDSACPVLLGESEDVNRSLNTLPARYKQAVQLFWQYEGRPMTWFAGRSGVGVDWRTFERRVIDGHELLKAELARYADEVRRYRAAIMA